MGRRVKVEPELKAEPVEHHVKVEEATSLKGSKGKSVKRERDTAPNIDPKAKRSRAETLADPFPHHKRPTPDECRAATVALTLLHGKPDRPQSPAENDMHTHTQHSVLDSLVRTILSQNTTDVNSIRAFESLKTAFPDWQGVLDAEHGEVEAAIRVGGLAQTKTERIKAILAGLLQERGELSLEHLRALPDEVIKQELSRYKGVGTKTISCVLMFCLGREDFPVDTHVWRISKQLGWVPGKATRDQAYAHLSTRVPPDLRYDLHVLLVEHGKRCARCAKASNAKHSKAACPLVNLDASVKEEA